MNYCVPVTARHGSFRGASLGYLTGRDFRDDTDTSPRAGLQPEEEPGTVE